MCLRGLLRIFGIKRKRMTKDIQLYINGMRADYDSEEPILFTYETTDYTNPTVVKNGFSKTVKLDGTPDNDRIFDEIWHLDRVMDSNFTLFNPSQRVSFELFKNGEIAEKGYVKLDSVDIDGYKRAYNITLYGGLGSFFYNLSYDMDTSREKTLADLNFTGVDNPDSELDFQIRRETVNVAWDYIGQDLWSVINFVPCYDVPDNFDKDKVLINTNGLEGTSVRYTTDSGMTYGTFPTAMTSNDVTYTARDGYVYGEMRREMDEWEMKDLRSYIQRPAVSVQSLIRAISMEENNGGYTVDLDTDFFSSGNPYYSSAWMTLPLLDNGTENTDVIEDWEWTLGSYTASTGNNALYYAKLQFTDMAFTPDTLTAKVRLYAEFTGATEDELYMETYLNNYSRWIQNALVIQLYGSNGIDDREGICGSDRYAFTTRDGNTYFRDVAQYTNMPFNDTSIEYIFGRWVKDSGSRYKWVSEEGNDTFNISMDTNNMATVPFVGICFNRVTDVWQYNVYAFNSAAFPLKSYNSIDNAMQGARVYGSGTTITDEGSTAVYQGNGTLRSYQTVTKQTLFGGLDMTPCDWLLSYCKLFGLFIFKDKVDDKIYIRLRKNFYYEDVKDIGKDVDVSGMAMTPLAFDSKWYSFNYLENECEFSEQYKGKYSNAFGTQLVDTRYNFDSEKVDLLEGTVFKNGLMALEKSNYFNNKYDSKGYKIPECLYDWTTVKYYHDGDTVETNMALPQGTTIETLNDYMPNEYWDVIPKLQLHTKDDSSIDGDCILVFFNGIKSTGKAEYWITDDIEGMFTESENPCWLATNSATDISGNTIAIKRTTLPEFSRYITSNTSWVLRWNTKKTWQSITADWDFGRTRELYVPYFKFDQDKSPTIYENYWKSYINDLYSVDTRKVDADIVLMESDVYEALRRFYWFANCIWVMTKITDYDIASDRLTRCSFTKVNEIGNYLEDITFDDRYFDFRRVGSGKVPYSGTTEELTVGFEVDCYADWQVTMNDYTIARFSNGAGFVNGHFGKNWPVSIIFWPNNTNSERSVTLTAENMDNGDIIQITVTQEASTEHYLRLINQTQEPPYVFTITESGYTNCQVQVFSSDEWMADTSESWITMTQSSGTSGSTYCRFDCQGNGTGSERRGDIKFSNGYDTAILTVVQKV